MERFERQHMFCEPLGSLQGDTSHHILVTASLTTIVKYDRVDHIYLQAEMGLGLYPNKVDPI